ncbi:MAG: acetate--CoA ligase [Phycisphaera sp.]|nr:acetate--CoA ligase [Phycisphaera sp.]
MSDSPQTGAFEDLLHETRSFPPSPQFTAQANVQDDELYKHAEEDYEGYWEQHAGELDWFEPWETVLDWTPPHCKWFVGGKLNITHNCIDRHLADNADKVAIIWEGEPGDERTITYQQLHDEVCQFSNALKKLGLEKGDRVAIYMPMVPEAAVAMLGCARIGAIHSVVFGGFSADSLSDRINDSECKALITSDFGWRRGKELKLKEVADEALKNTHSIEHVIVHQRDADNAYKCHMESGRDHWYHELIDGESTTCEPEIMDAEDVLFILYTSGTTGKPKGIVHTCGGYSVGAYVTTKYVFDLHDDDVYWCTADVGWITGHSYIVYGPLQNAATQVMYEGAPNFPGNDRFWELVAKHKVSVFYTAPTAIRAFMKWGDDLPAKHDLSTLRLLGSVGEPINPEAWMWYHKHIGGENCPIVDTWWQTETGSIMISGLPGVTTMVPGSAGPALPGIAATIVDEKAEPVKKGSGLLAVTKPWPSMLRTIWGDDDRFVETYFSKWPGRPDLYFPGDGAKLDDKGNFTVLGRVDDVLNVSGHRIGTMEVESALVDHPAVAESAVVGTAHELKGQAIVAFVTVKGGVEMTDALNAELRQHVATKIGAIARPEKIIFTADLPKTRSGKIMRRLLRDIAAGRALGDTTTLADPSVVESLRHQYGDKEG